jgi:hypothetical protein
MSFAAAETEKNVKNTILRPGSKGFGPAGMLAGVMKNRGKRNTGLRCDAADGVSAEKRTATVHESYNPLPAALIP